jgi:ubiquinone/menaquinone biosynthesis C-methylase UbiE
VAVDADGKRGAGQAVAAGWDTYWHGAGGGAAFSRGGTSHPLVLSFWDEFFGKVREDYTRPRVVDIASGSGAVVDCARAALGGIPAEFTCVDISESAIAALVKRLPDVTGVVADARDIPLESEAYDIATSQFGIEYAGLDAVYEIARLPAPGGRLALLLHHRHGGIYRQCAASLDAIRMMQAEEFVPRVIETFEAGFAAYRGGSKSAYQAAATRLNPALRAVESIMRKHGRDVADGTVVRLYKDVAAVHGRLPNYEPSEVLSWLRGLQKELEAYAERMASMCDAAIDADTFEKLRDGLQHKGFVIDRADALQNAATGVPLGWALIATRV